MKQIDDILLKYCPDRSNLLPILNEMQNQFGYLSREAMEAVARYLRLTDGTVYGVATFYPGFKFTPSGRHCVKACRGTACHVKGAKKVLGELEKRLGIKPGETTEDLEYSLDTVACTGACALAPVVIIDDEPHGEMTSQKVEEVLGEADGKT
jgi:NADH:ubiquinone oxidoreductase subunit E